MLTPSQSFREREGLLEKYSSGKASEDRGNKGQHCRIGYRQMVQGEVHPSKAYKATMTKGCQGLQDRL